MINSKRFCSLFSVWSLEKLNNKIYDMRDLYNQCVEENIPFSETVCTYTSLLYSIRIILLFASWISLNFRSPISRASKFLKLLFGPWKFWIFYWMRDEGSDCKCTCCSVQMSRDADEMRKHFFFHPQSHLVTLARMYVKPPVHRACLCSALFFFVLSFWEGLEFLE